MHKGVIKFLCIEHIYSYVKKYRKSIWLGLKFGRQCEGRSAGSWNRNGLVWMGGLGKGERESERFGGCLEILKLRLSLKGYPKVLGAALT